MTDKDYSEGLKDDFEEKVLDIKDEGIEDEDTTRGGVEEDGQEIEEGIVKDSVYEQVIERGNEEYDPSKDPDATVKDRPSRSSPPSLRPSTMEKREAEGLYAEDESGFEPSAQTEEGDLPDTDETDTSRRLTSFVSASHRSNRTPEAKRQSAEKASALHEQITGSPLEINQEGEVVTGPRISAG